MESLKTHSGSAMIEVLVTTVILMVGLLGLAGLQSRVQSSEMEAYQRTQALILLSDMSNRIAINRAHAADYVTADYLGAGMDCPTSSVDAREWCESLQGVAETSGSARMGAMLGGRGCVELRDDGSYMVTVAWQGLVPLSAPSVGTPCARGLYDNPGTPCVNDSCRRVVTTVVRVASLT
ncbi:MAG: pilus assembly protein [Methylobacillus sp.]|nr:pilus assembly protein [Methylobacillus sp.]